MQQCKTCLWLGPNAGTPGALLLFAAQALD